MSVNQSEELAPLVRDTPEEQFSASPPAQQRAVAAPLWRQVLLCSCFFAVSVGLPFLNKYVFGYLPQHDGAGALTPSIVMLLGASALLWLLALAQWALWGRAPQLNLAPRRVLLFLLPALGFAAVMALTNTSLELTSVNLHVVLKSTALVWTVLLAWLLERERPSLLALLCCALLTAAAAMASCAPDVGFGFTGTESSGERAAAIALTAAAALAQGLLLVLTRRTARVLGGRASLELAAFKVTHALLMLLLLTVTSVRRLWLL
jgi:drug/metabolite transporter (DMT)-like permease